MEFLGLGSWGSGLVSVVIWILMLSSSPESMRGLLKHIREEYGSAEGYFLKMTKLSGEDLECVRRVLVVSDSDREDGVEGRLKDSGKGGDDRDKEEIR